MKSYGIKKGDRVAIYLPVSPIAVASMLACAKIGAVHSVVFAGFSSDSLAARINDCRFLFVYNSSLIISFAFKSKLLYSYNCQ